MVRHLRSVLLDRPCCCWIDRSLVSCPCCAQYRREFVWCCFLWDHHVPAAPPDEALVGNFLEEIQREFRTRKE